MISNLILQIARGIWAIEPNAAEAYRPIVQAILKGESTNGLMPLVELKEDFSKNQQPFFVNTMDECGSKMTASIHSTFDDIKAAPRNSVAITPLTGVVMKNDFCGSPGTKTLNSWMKEADSNENIIAHVLYVDSPGGSVDGTMDFSESIKTLNKPVVAFADGLMASAAYWIGSSAKHIMASNKLNQIGSIGTYITLTDWSKHDEMNGIRDIEIYATKSTEKNIEYREALKGNEDLMKQRLDVFNEAFLSGVKRNRFGKSLNADNTLKGQLHFSSEALQYGLIDSIGTFEDAVNKAISLTKKNK